MGKKILIIAPYQFGELSDCYYWAKYATIEGWKVTYIGYKYKHRCIKERFYPGVKVKSVIHFKNRKFLGLLFYLKCITEIIIHNQHNVIICRMPMCQLLPKLFPNRNIILDVRTLSISKDPQTREKQDNALINLKKMFHTCSVISEGVGQKIGAPFKILPLGAESISTIPKRFDEMRMFYIGTFDNRNLSIFIEGLAMYQNKTGSNEGFDIIGGGSYEETKVLKDTINSTGVKNVRMHGYLTHEEAKKFFDKCNVGVCFVPVTDYYQHQPPTKLYEYLLSGMAAISTNTISNEAIMNANNGIIVHDNPESVCKGLCQLSSKLPEYNSQTIVTQSQNYNWSYIVKKNLLTLAR